ncbi:MAG: PEP-CTERM sorting domain-containing protein [Pyrinomonadaceae bacterium]|nr:PEP-CTERM sorting domain-containing protein [Pyrinomonadaceae bacterium]
MKRQASRSIVAVLGFLLLAAVPTQAGPIQFADVVVRTLIGEQTGRPSVDFQLRSSAQSQGGQKNSPTAPNTVAGSVPSVLTGDGPGTPLTSVVVAPLQDGDIIEVGEVTGTICDCGEIPLLPVAGFAFPKLALLGLAAIPLAFIDLGGDSSIETAIPSPLSPSTTTPPTPIPEPIPEPATMILFGSGLLALGAQASRRRAHRSTAKCGDEETLSHVS